MTKLQHTILNHNLKTIFIHCYIETVFPGDSFFDILLVFVTLLQTYYDISLFPYSFFSFFSSSDKFLCLSFA